MFGAENNTVIVNGETTDYVKFGRGDRILVFIPGVGDGLKTVKGTALSSAFSYRQLAQDFTVYFFSRPRNLQKHMTTRDMAQSLKDALDALGIKKASIVGISQGGMIAQWLAIDHPEVVKRLVLVVTIARPNPTIERAIGIWVEQAKTSDYKGMKTSMAELSFSPKKARRAMRKNRLLALFDKPQSFERFLIQAESCLTHDAYDHLNQIQHPTLVFGGSIDKIASGEASKEIAAQIPGSTLVMYDHLGHALYEEAPDYLSLVAEFCTNKEA